MRRTEVIVGLLILVQLSSSSTLVRPDADEVSKTVKEDVASMSKTNQQQSPPKTQEKQDGRSFSDDVSSAVEKLKCTFMNCDKDKGSSTTTTTSAPTTAEPTTTTTETPTTSTAAPTTSTAAPTTSTAALTETTPTPTTSSTGAP